MTLTKVFSPRTARVMFTRYGGAGVALETSAKPAPETNSLPPLTSAKSHSKTLASIDNEATWRRACAPTASASSFSQVKRQAEVGD